MQVEYRLDFAVRYQPSPHFLSGSFSPSKLENGSESSPARQKLRKETTAGRSALVVDDVADVTEMLQVLLTHAGYDVITAASAKAALQIANEREFDVIISDIGMPDMNGYQLAEALRLLPAYKTVPLVAVTGYSMFDDQERSLKAGFNAHMTKPIDPRALLDLIEQL